MPTQLVIALIRSLLPFAREAIVGNKELRELLLSNKSASILAGCLLFVFALLVHSTGNVEHLSSELEKVSKERDELMEHLGPVIEEVQDGSFDTCQCSVGPETRWSRQGNQNRPPDRIPERMPVGERSLEVAPPPRMVPLLKNRIQERIHQLD